VLPQYLKEKLRSTMPRPAINAGVLAFRVYMAGKTYHILTEDVKQHEGAKSLTPA
jgi:hypothetical protein